MGGLTILQVEWPSSMSSSRLCLCLCVSVSFCCVLTLFVSLLNDKYYSSSSPLGLFHCAVILRKRAVPQSTRSGNIAIHAAVESRPVCSEYSTNTKYCVLNGTHHRPLNICFSLPPLKEGDVVNFPNVAHYSRLSLA